MSTAATSMRLSELRKRLGWLRARRWFVRMGSGWTALVTALVVTFAIAFAADFLLELRWIERLAVLLMVVLSGLWSFRRYTSPFLGIRENELDMALIVERRQKIDSDLVAAIQFEQAESVAKHASLKGAGDFGRAHGSRELREAVIDYVADFGRSIDVFAGMSHGQFRRRARWCAVACVATILAVAIYPRHAAAFFNRLLLGNAHYPTATEIVDVRVNDRSALPLGGGEPLPGLPDGVPIRFSLRVEGVSPESAEVRFAVGSHGGLSTLSLRPVTADGAKDSASNSSAGSEFVGTLPRLAENASFQVLREMPGRSRSNSAWSNGQWWRFRSTSRRPSTPARHKSRRGMGRGRLR